MDIAQNAQKVVFCGTFDAKGAAFETGDGQMTITRQGTIQKLVEKVDQVTFSGEQARRQGQEVLYVTERCVFRLTDQGLTLTEIAPGVDLQRDILDRLGFSPVVVDDLKSMNPTCFTKDGTHVVA